MEHSKQEEVKNRIKQAEEVVTNNWKIAFSKISKNYEDDMKAGATQFLLNYVDEKNNDTAKDNIKGFNHHPKNGQTRGGRYRRGGYHNPTYPQKY